MPVLDTTTVVGVHPSCFGRIARAEDGGFTRVSPWTDIRGSIVWGGYEQEGVYVRCEDEMFGRGIRRT